MIDSSLDLSRTQQAETSLSEIETSTSPTMVSTMVLSQASQQRQIHKSGGTSFFIRDLLMKDVCKSPKGNSSPISSDDENLQERQHPTLNSFGHFYQNGHLPNDLSTYFDHCLSRINQNLYGGNSANHQVESKNNLISAETFAKAELNGHSFNKGKFI